MLGSLAASGGVVMILEIDSPFSRILHVSSEAIRKALAQIGGWAPGRRRADGTARPEP